MSILSEFTAKLEQALTKYANDLWHVGRSDDGHPCFPADDSEVASKIGIASGRCGAACGASVKRAKRLLVFEHLVQLKESGIDLTYHTVQNLAVRLLGRKFQGKTVLSKFSTPGRTASDKTATNTETLFEAEQVLHKQLEELTINLALERNKAREDWRSQRTEDLKHKI